MCRKCCKTLTKGDEGHDGDLHTVADKNGEKHAILWWSEHIAMDSRSTWMYVDHRVQDH